MGLQFLCSTTPSSPANYLLLLAICRQEDGKDITAVDSDGMRWKASSRTLCDLLLDVIAGGTLSKDSELGGAVMKDNLRVMDRWRLPLVHHSAAGAHPEA